MFRQKYLLVSIVVWEHSGILVFQQVGNPVWVHSGRLVGVLVDILVWEPRKREIVWCLLQQDQFFKNFNILVYNCILESGYIFPSEHWNTFF